MTAGEQLRAASESDWIDFMSEPSPFDQDDYDYADGFYARRALARHPAMKPSRSVAKERRRLRGSLRVRGEHLTADLFDDAIHAVEAASREMKS